MAQTYTRLARLRTAQEFQNYTHSLGVELPFDEAIEPAPDGPLAQPYHLKDGTAIGNRFAVHPMEGWDGTEDGRPTEYTLRRWQNFGTSGAKLIWGGEAVAVRHDGRANPNQLIIQPHTLAGLENLRSSLINAHVEAVGSPEGLLIGLQLTHSGRFARPNDKKRLEPRILYHHPLLDKMFNVPPEHPVWTDDEIDDLIADFVIAASRARELGFDFVDIKHCHGYLGHEFLSSRLREGRYGGSFENRTRFLREITAGIRRDAPDLRIGVRVSIFDFVPFRAGEDGVGEPLFYQNEAGRYPYAFGGDPDNPLMIDQKEPVQFLELLESLGIELVNLSVASPYYNPHLMRPAFFPPSDGYLPPEDPLVGVARQIHNVAELKSRFPGMAMVGTGYSYLQEWLPNVAQYAVRTGMTDFIGLGRMILTYPEMPRDMLAGKELERKRICRTFSDCTTAPRNGMISGCYPLDPFYKELPEAEQLKAVKKEQQVS
jgi:NADPH2 dehydrogenase